MINMEIEKIKITDIIPANYNPRKISENELQKLTNSINEFGLVDPIIINLKNNVIIGGHQRYEVLINQYMLNNDFYAELNIVKLGDIGWIFTEEDLKIKDENHEKALNLALNKISGEWDFDKLDIILEDLKLNNFDIELTGFDETEIEEFEEGINTIEDDFEEDEIEINVKLGDIFQLGNHILMCGDSTLEKDINKLINNNDIDMIFTDPPYGMNAVTKSGVLSEKYKNDIMNDDDNEVAIKSFKLANRLFPNAYHIWWGANYYTECLPSNECWLVWDKNNGLSDQTDCELAYTNLRSAVRQFTLASEKKNRVHPTQKPIKLYEEFFNRFNKLEVNNILDLFGGSGSTLIFSEQANKKCFLMELAPYYCQIIINRWEEFTGNKAKKINGDE